MMCRELARRGVTLLEADTDGVYFAVPEDWSEMDERRVVSEVNELLPPLVQLEFDGRYEGKHPLLIPVTDNNMVSGEATSPIRYQMAPVLVDLSEHSREEVMDQHPMLWRVMAKEMEREAKIRLYGKTVGSLIGC